MSSFGISSHSNFFLFFGIFFDDPFTLPPPFLAHIVNGWRIPNGKPKKQRPKRPQQRGSKQRSPGNAKQEPEERRGSDE
jgi:hypothetical protein